MDIKDNINLGILNAAELLLEHGRIPPEQAAVIRRRALYDMTKEQIQQGRIRMPSNEELRKDIGQTTAEKMAGQPVRFGFDLGRAPSGGVYRRLTEAGIDPANLSKRVTQAIDNGGGVFLGSKGRDIDVTMLVCPEHGFEEITVNMDGRTTEYNRDVEDESETEFTDRVLREAKANHGDVVKATILDAINEANEKRSHIRR